MANAMILLRAQTVDDELRALAGQLTAISGLPIAMILDERNATIDAGTFAKVSLTREACEGLGLYCPGDFAWRCGDYGVYLARTRYPDVSYFWLFESDVRVAGTDPEGLFRKYSADTSDLIASHLAPPPDPWHWRPMTASRDAAIMTCFFPVARFSAKAIDILLAKRRVHSRIATRRRLWPNDEAFVATTLTHAGLKFRDLNEGDPKIYSEAEFSFDSLRDGSLPLTSAQPVALFHPVLCGEALALKQQRLATRRKQRGPIEQAIFRINRKIGVNAMARWINRLRKW